MKQGEDYRILGLQDLCNEIEQNLRYEKGLLPADLELIGAILLIKHQGENEKFDKRSQDILNTMKETEALLNNLKLKYNL